MKVFYWVLLLLCPYPGISQAPKPERELHRGDALPPLYLQGFINYRVAAAPLHSFKGKWLLLDFMASTCPSCIALLPGFAALQKKYSRQLQVLLVSAEPAEKIQAFLKKRAPFPLPVLAGDRRLKALFPHEYISHLVWISPGGTVAAITGGERLTEQNLLKAISGEPLNWPVKKDAGLYDYSQPLFTLNNANIPEWAVPDVKYQFALAGAMANITPRYIRSMDTATNTQQVIAINYSIPQLFCRLYNQPRFIQSHILIEARDLQRFYRYDSNLMQEDWNGQHRYCMQANMPGQWADTAARKKLRQELEAFFSCSVSLRPETVPVLLLTKTGQAATNRPAADSVTLGTVLYRLNGMPNSQPVLEVGDGRGNEWLFFNGSLPKERDGLLAFLQQEGYTISGGSRVLDILRIKAL